MLKRIIAAAVIFYGGIIAGCGGGSGGAPGATVSGIVADGYLRGAEVFMDKNGNYRWDAGEPKTTTGIGGVYHMTVSAADAAKYPVMARVIAGTTVDEDTKVPVASGYVMSAPPGAAGFISPMSTLIREKMAANPGMTLTDAMTQLRNQMNLPVGIDMMADYVAGSQPGSPNVPQYQTMHATARQMAGLMAGQALLVMNNGSAVDMNRYRSMMGTINSNMPGITDNAVNGLGMDSSFMTSMRNQMVTTIQNMPIGSGFMNYSGMFRNMTSHSAFWNYTGNRWQPGGTMGSGGMMGKLRTIAKPLL